MQTLDWDVVGFSYHNFVGVGGARTNLWFSSCDACSRITKESKKEKLKTWFMGFALMLHACFQYWCCMHVSACQNMHQFPWIRTKWTFKNEMRITRMSWISCIFACRWRYWKDPVSIDETAARDEIAFLVGGEIGLEWSCAGWTSAYLLQNIKASHWTFRIPNGWKMKKDDSHKTVKFSWKTLGCETGTLRRARMEGHFGHDSDSDPWRDARKGFVYH